jgi:glycerol-3-phosphate dehydrogenase
LNLDEALPENVQHWHYIVRAFTFVMDSESLQFDVIIIGAGINGAGIARDAASRGLRVLLLDKGDIGGGTSSWSTRLIHGGLRYLEHGEFRLVRESLRERETLLRIAPHLVRPLPLLVPVYENAHRGIWTIRAGMMAYDALSFRKSLPGHRWLSCAETVHKVPGLEPVGLLGAASYFDAQVEFAERLVLENVLAAVAYGARVVTYARVDKLLVDDGSVCGVRFSRRQGDATVATARIVINAAGPWVDHLLDTASLNSERLIGGTKGSHLVVAPFSGAPRTAIYVEAETDGRPFFIIPWNNKYLIGTTDIPFDGNPDEARITDGEIDYLLHEANRVLPTASLTRKQILFAYSGVRPLPYTADRAARKITRRHFIKPHRQVVNLFSIVGGKLTTYRSLAEQAVDAIFKRLGQDPPDCKTDRESLPGAAPDFRAFSDQFQQRSPFSPATTDRLLRIYGTRAELIMKLVKQDQSLGEVFDPETGAFAAEIVFAFTDEFAATLADCLLRRAMVGLNSTCGLDAIDAAGRIARRCLGWSEDRVTEETAAYRQEVLTRLAVGLP